MIFGLILASGAFALIAWLIFNLSVYALPFFVGVSAASFAHRTGGGLVGSATVGLIAGAVTFGVGQAAFGVTRSASRAASWRRSSQCQRPSLATTRRWGSSRSAFQVQAGGKRSRSSAASSIGSVAFRRLAAFAPLREAEPVGQPTLNLFSACSDLGGRPDVVVSDLGGG